MSNKLTAKQLAAKGRNGDTMLVHMSPDEVAGLQYLALASGGPLTINPETGLVEAFKLKKLFKSILPTILGAVLAPLTGGSSLAIAGLIGAGTGIIKKDWKAGLMAGLGAFGGANIGAKLAGLGKGAAAAGTTNAAAQAGDVVSSTLAQGTGSADPLLGQAAYKIGAGDAAAAGFKTNALGGVANPSGGIADLTGKELLGMGQAGMKAGPGGIAGVKANFGNIVQGAKAANPLGKGYVPGTLGKAVGLSDATMAFGPALGTIGAQTTEDASAPEDDSPYYLTQYNQGQLNPNFGQPGESYFIDQSFGPGRWEEEYPGMPKKAEGGPIQSGLASLPEASNDIQQYIRALNTENTPRLLYNQATAPVDPNDPYSNMYNAAVRSRLSQQLGQEFTPRPYTPPATEPPPTSEPPATPTPAQPSRPRWGWWGFKSRNRPEDDLSGGAKKANPFDFSKIKDQKERENWEKAPRYTYQPGKGFTPVPTTSPTKKAAGGGIGTLPEAGRYIAGGGDGVSDSVPAVINGKQPARLADGEYVLDARTVSEIGNGSSSAGAKKLSQMVNRVHKARAGAKRGKPSGADRYLPA